MRLFYSIIAGALLLIQNNLNAQSPYAIAPKWYFGYNAGLSFPTSGAPTFLPGGMTGGGGQEESSTMCDPDGNVIFYTDSYSLYNGNHTFVQTINGGTSSTNSSICFPDPANPTTEFYLVTANQDPLGGGTFASTLGIYYYRIRKTGPGTITVFAGPTMLATNGQVSEQLCGGSDGNGGYWIVTHQGGGSGANGNQIWSWHVTASGVGARQTSSVAGTENNNSFNGSMKINKCQTRLAAIYKTKNVEVYTWDKTTGTVTGVTSCSNSSSMDFGYGCEFSPNGDVLYFTDLVGNQLYQWDFTNTTVATAVVGGTSSNSVGEMGTLQLGPDNKIYVTNVAHDAVPVYIGVVNNPNVVGAGCNYNRTGFTLNNGPALKPATYRGIANQAWINPTLDINNTGACKDINFSYDFKTYFGANVAVTAGSEQWDFGDGAGLQSGLGATPTHTYAAGGPYTITLKVTDASCTQVWTQTKSITVNNCGCTPPTSPTSVTISTGRDLCSNFTGSVTLTASGGTTGDPVEWYTASCGGTLVFTGNPLVVPLVNPTAGIYKYYIRRTNACGSSSCIADSIVVHALPVAPANAAPSTATFCSGASGNVSLTATGGSGERLVWYRNSCGSSSVAGNGTPLSIGVPGSTTDYFVRWESTGCPSSSCVQTTITITPSPTPSIGSNASICRDSVRTFSTAASGNTYNWVFTTSGTGTITSGQSTNGIALNMGSAGGTLELTETNAASCSTTVSVQLSLLTPGGTVAMAGPDKNVCSANVQLNANNINGVWTVYNGTGTFTPNTNTYNATVSGLSTGLNQFIWTTTGTCGFISRDTVALTLGTSSLSVAIYANSDTACFGSPKDIQVLVAGTGSGSYNYVWTSSDNSFNLSTATSNVTVNPLSTVTTYYLVVQDNVNTGCTAGNSVAVYAMEDQELVVPNLITPNGDSKNDYLEIRDINETKILPGAKLEVVNRWGDRVYDHSDYDNTWSGANLSDGVYYYYLKSGCGKRVYKGWLEILH